MNGQYQWPGYRAIRTTLAPAALVTLLLCQRHMGFIVFFEILFLTPWLLLSLWKMYRDPKARSQRITEVAIWLLSVATIFGVHHVHASNAKAKAQKIIDSVEEYKTLHGRYPDETEKVEFNNAMRNAGLWLGYYTHSPNGPVLMYADTFIVHDYIQYDFLKKSWSQIAD